MKQSKLLGLGTIALAAVMMTACGGDVPDPGNTTCDPACTDGKVCKDGQCVSESTSECDPACTDGKVCKDGQCVDKEVPKPGECDPACGENQECKDGTCVSKEISCPDGQTLCGETCRDLSKENEHCGQCDNACTDGKQCVNSACDFVCDDSAPDKCDDGCHNFKSDVNNCGACGKKCGENEGCNEGTCGLACNSGETACGSACADLLIDNENCGVCGKTCITENGELCKEGKCEMTCPAGQEKCGDGKCYDLDSDASCGTCDSHPACDTANNKHCSANRLCETACTDSDSHLIFVDLMTTPAFCGSCDNACNEGELCNDGNCSLDCGSEKTLCGEICVDAKTDVAHCGCGGRDVPEGGINCAELPNVAEGASCAEGVCVISACLEGFADCDKDPTNGCEANLSDPETCGSCEHACKDENAESASCNAGVCEFVCKSGMQSCNGICKDIQKDNDNCGWCDNKCGSDATCQNGFCTIDSNKCDNDNFVTTTINDQPIKAYCIKTENEFRLMCDAINSGKKYAGDGVPPTQNANNAYIIMDNLIFGDDPNWIPVGTSSNPFSQGYFLGNGKKITGNFITQGYDGGLFGVVRNSVLSGMNVEINITAQGTSVRNVAPLAGGIYNSVVQYSKSTNSKISDPQNTDSGNAERLGGLIGIVQDSKVLYSIVDSAKITQHAGGEVGGVTGYGPNSIFDHCIVKDFELVGDQPARYFDAEGGLVGVDSASTMTNCTTSGKITFTNSTNRSNLAIGGILGWSNGNSKIVKCSSSIEINAPNSSYTGGIFGYNSSGIATIEDSYSTGPITCLRACGGVAGGNPQSSSNQIHLKNCWSNAKITSTDETAGNGSAGGVIGDLRYGSITNCHATGDIQGGTAYLGGIVGYLAYSKVDDSYATGNVTSRASTDANYAGGAIGWTVETQINNIYAKGDVKGYSHVGGLIGRHCNNSVTKNVAAFGDVTALSQGTSAGTYHGGLIASHCLSSTVENGLAAGDVKGESTQVGGAIGHSNASTSRNVYSLGKVTGKANVGAFLGYSWAGTEVVKNCYYKQGTHELDIGTGQPQTKQLYSFDFNNEQEAVLTSNSARKLTEALGNDWISAPCKLKSGTITIPIPKALGADICK